MPFFPMNKRTTLLFALAATAFAAFLAGCPDNAAKPAGAPSATPGTAAPSASAAPAGSGSKAGGGW